jgi:hypothetical protein
MCHALFIRAPACTAILRQDYADYDRIIRDANLKMQ